MKKMFAEMFLQWKTLGNILSALNEEIDEGIMDIHTMESQRVIVHNEGFLQYILQVAPRMLFFFLFF
jgi:hypothetical protein